MVKEKKLDLSRQSKLVPEEAVSQYTIKIFGVGSVGSHVAKVLCKTGFQNIEVYDADVVEEENLAAQAFDFEHLGMKKVDAIVKACHDSSGVSVIGHHGIIDEKTKIEPEPNTIYMCFFDSFEARKMLYDKLKDYNIMFIDGRIGRYDMRYYVVDCSDKAFMKEYGATLTTGKESELICGEKASAPINVQLAGMITMQLINYISEKDYISLFIGNATMPNNDMRRVKERKKT